VCVLVANYSYFLTHACMHAGLSSMENIIARGQGLTWTWGLLMYRN